MDFFRPYKASGRDIELSLPVRRIRVRQLFIRRHALGLMVHITALTHYKSMRAPARILQPVHAKPRSTNPQLMYFEILIMLLLCLIFKKLGSFIHA